MTILSTTPVQGDVNVSLSDVITVIFDQNVKPESVTDSAIVVATKKTNVVMVSGGLPQPDDIFASDDFFDSEFTGIVEGTVSVVDATVTFTLARKLAANTLFTVYVGTSLIGADDSTLDKIKSFDFTTREEDMIEPLPEVEGLTTIIGTTLSFSDSTATGNVASFYIQETDPKNDSFLISSNNVTITLSEDVEAGQEAKVTVFVYDILSDYPAEALIVTDDYVVTLDTNKINIVIDSGYDSVDKVFEIRIDQTLTSVGGNVLASAYSFQFIKQLSVYYSSTKIIRLKAGSVLTNITDVNLAIMIYYSSLNADVLFSNTCLPSDSIEFLKQKYVLYDALESTLMNNFSMGLNDYVKKQLAEFNIAVSSKTKVGLYNNLLTETKRNKDMIKAMIAYCGNSGLFNRRARSSDIGRLWPRGAKPGINSKVNVGTKFIQVWDPFSEPIIY